jgi:hypothetical protein
MASAADPVCEFAREARQGDAGSDANNEWR